MQRLFKKNKKGETVLVQDEYIRKCRVKIFILFRLSLFIIIFILFLRSLMNYEVSFVLRITYKYGGFVTALISIASRKRWANRLEDYRDSLIKFLYQNATALLLMAQWIPPSNWGQTIWIITIKTTQLLHKLSYGKIEYSVYCITTYSIWKCRWPLNK